MQESREFLLENKKTSKLVWDYALPAIIGTIVNALYNIVDRIFIGQGVGALAISGLAITFPVINLTSSLGMLVGAGSASRISISLGQKNKHRAEQILGNALLLTLLLNAVFMTLFYIYLKPILMAFGASEETYPYASEYLRVVLLGNVFISLCYSFNNMMRASGYPKKAMYTMLIGAVLNVLLDPLFLFVFDTGIKGVAWATVISMFVGMLFVMHHFTRESSVIRLRRRNIRFNKNILWAIISIGLSPFSMQVAASMVAVLMNTSLLKYGGDLSVGAFGIWNSIALMMLMVVMGLNQGTQPIIGYNYGAKRYDRVRSTFYYAVKVATLITTFGFFVGIFFPRTLANIFTSDKALLDIAENGIRIAVLAYPLVGFQVVTSSFFQSIGKAKKSIIQTLSRQLLFLIPCLLIFPNFWQLNGVWAALPISDLLAAVLSLSLLMLEIKAIRKLEDDQKFNLPVR